MATLYAGKFSSTPIFAQVMRGGIVGFYNADNVSCWSDLNHRTVVASMDHARALLDAHGFVLGSEILRPADTGGVATASRFNIYRKGEEPVPAPAADAVLDELSVLRMERDTLLARVAELEAQLAAAQRLATQWDEHHPAYIQGAKDAARIGSAVTGGKGRGR